MRGCRQPSSPRCTPSCAAYRGARSRRMEPLPKLRAAARGLLALACARTVRPRQKCHDSGSSRRIGAWAASAASGARRHRQCNENARFWRAKASSSTRTAGSRPLACSESCPRRVSVLAPTTRHRLHQSAPARRRPKPSLRRRRCEFSRHGTRARPADRRRRRGGSRPRATLLIGGRGCRRRTPRCATWWGAAASS